MKKQRPKTWNGQCQDTEPGLVVVGPDVEALYLSLTDMEVANLCNQKMKKEIRIARV
jgi:hypothetical protein